MTYSQLKAFHAVAIERSFQKAAERLNLTQPAISIQVRNLENDSEQTLFRRRGQSIELTEQGKCLFENTTEMFRAEEKCKTQLLPSHSSVTQVLHLGADGPHVALELLHRFKNDHKNIQVRVTLANAEETWKNLNGLKVDAVVMANAPFNKKIVSETL